MSILKIKKVYTFLVGIMIMTTILMCCSSQVQAASTIKIGDYVVMGKYYDEPILWRCVDIDENGPLMLADKILSIKPFDAAGNHKYSDGTNQADVFNASETRTLEGSNLWETSSMRSWLNSTAMVTWLDGCPPTADKVFNGYNEYADEEGFLSEGNFTVSEQNAIKSVTQKSLLNSFDVNKLVAGGTALHTFDMGIQTVVQNYGTAYYQNITDKVFLLDVKQLNKVYQNSSILGTNYYIGKPTQKALDKTEYKDSRWSTTNYIDNWTRSPYAVKSPYDVRYVTLYGDVGATAANFGVAGVRPAFYLDLSSANLTNGDGSIENPYNITDGKMSSDATLRGLSSSIGTLNPSFDPLETIYTLEVPDNISSLVITPTVNESHASVVVNGGSSNTINLDDCQNYISVVVTAQDGTTKNIYGIIVDRYSATSPVSIINQVQVSNSIDISNPNSRLVFNGDIKSSYKIKGIKLDFISQCLDSDGFSFSNKKIDPIIINNSGNPYEYNLSDLYDKITPDTKYGDFLGIGGSKLFTNCGQYKLNVSVILDGYSSESVPLIQNKVINVLGNVITYKMRIPSQIDIDAYENDQIGKEKVKYYEFEIAFPKQIENKLNTTSSIKKFDELVSSNTIGVNDLTTVSINDPAVNGEYFTNELKHFIDCYLFLKCGGRPDKSDLDYNLIRYETVVDNYSVSDFLSNYQNQMEEKYLSSEEKKYLSLIEQNGIDTFISATGNEALDTAVKKIKQIKSIYDKLTGKQYDYINTIMPGGADSIEKNVLIKMIYMPDTFMNDDPNKPEPSTLADYKDKVLNWTADGDHLISRGQYFAPGSINPDTINLFMKNYIELYTWALKNSGYKIFQFVDPNDLKNYDLASNSSNAKKYEAHCPVRMEIYDDAKNLVATISDDGPNIQYFKFGNLYRTDKDGETIKTAYIFDNRYKVRIFGTGTGSMNYSVSDLNQNGSIAKEYKYDSVPITNSTIIDVDESNQNQLLIDNNADGNNDLNIPPIVDIFYAVNFESLTGGSITANQISATSGTDINLIITPDEGMRLKAGSLKYNDGTKDYPITGTSFTIPAANVTVSAEFESATTSLVKYQGAQKRVNSDGATDIRFIATIDTLDPDTVGFVFSKTGDPLPTIDNASVKSTSTVYSSIIADGKTLTATKDLGGNYIIACAVTDIPKEDYDKPLYVRAFSTKGTVTTYTDVHTVTVNSLQ